MTTRIYECKATVTTNHPKPNNTEEHVYLVEASSRNSAEKHVAGKYVGKAEIAAPKRIVELMGAGTKVETATASE